MVKDRQEPTLSSVDEDLEKLQNLPALSAIKMRRDKFHAHFDKDFFFDRKTLQENHPIIWRDMDLIMETISDLINRYSADYDGNVHDFKPININDVDDILDALHEKKERQLNKAIEADRE